MRIKIKKGLDIPIKGEPEKVIEDAAAVRTVAAVATDVSGIRPRMAVQVGDKVRLGQVLYHDKRNPDVPFTAPGAGEVIEVNRGARRALQSVVIRLDGDEAETFGSWQASELATLDQQTVRDNLIASGLWTMLRTRPYSRIPAPGETPAAIFVTAIDTNPLAIDPAFFIEQDPEAFENGLKVLSRIADCPVYVCTAPDSGIRCPEGEQFRRYYARLATGLMHEYIDEASGALERTRNVAVDALVRMGSCHADVTCTAGLKSGEVKCLLPMGSGAVDERTARLCVKRRWLLCARARAPCVSAMFTVRVRARPALFRPVSPEFRPTLGHEAARAATCST